MDLENRCIVAAFDFDGTITSRDTFVPFLFLAFGRVRVVKAFISLAFEGLFITLGLSGRDAFKQKIVKKLFAGSSVERLRETGRQHAKKIERLFRPAALKRIEWHRTQGHRLVMVSASLDLYLAPIVEKLAFDDLLCTRLSIDDLRFDGQLAGANCRAAEKVHKLAALLGDLADIELYAYGDSAGDKEMLAAATHPFYRPFETGGALGW